MTYEVVKTLAKRARYKNIDDEADILYCHFVFQGFRIEALKEIRNNYFIICICKGGSAKNTNNIQKYNNNVIYISDNFNEYIFESKLYDKFIKALKLYICAHSNWFVRDQCILL